MTGSTLDALFHPRAIAVIGASNSSGKVGRRVMEALVNVAVPVHPVHPTADMVCEKPVIHSIAELPAGIDLAIIATSAVSSVAAAEACAEKGIPYVVVLASGFSESGAEGKALEERLSEIPRDTGTRILGPNTLGFQIPGSGVDTVFVDHAGEAVAGGATALVSQSGSVAVEALLSACRYGFGLRAFVGLGNKVDLSEPDFLDYFAADPETRCICLYIEDLSAGREFLATAGRHALTKPILAIKAGASESGAAAASSHTGRLSGSDRVIDGALRQHRIQRVQDDEELLDAATVLSLASPPAGNRVASLTPAGGYGVMLADMVERDVSPVLEMATLGADTTARLEEILVGFASCHNPVDLTASVDDDTYMAALELLIADESVDIVVCVVFFAPPGITPALADRVALVAAKADKPVIVFAGDEDGTGEVHRRLHSAGVASFPSLSRAIRAVRNLVRRQEIVRVIPEREIAPDLHLSPDVDRRNSLRALSGTLDEYKAKQVLGEYGLRIPASCLVTDPAEGPEFAGPYVAKVCSPAIVHKTEQGGVRVNVSPGDLPGVIAELNSRFPGEPILVEQFVRHSGVELIAGAFNDPELGPCIMLGAGGVLAELYKDVVFRLLPCTAADVHGMLDQLVVGAVFKGYRGLGCKADQIVDLVLRVGAMVSDLGDRFRELDINPLVCTESGLVILDASLSVTNGDAGSSLDV